MNGIMPNARRTLGAFLVSCTLAVTLTACGDNKFLEDIKMRTWLDGEDAWGEMKAQLNTGNAMLPVFDIPILNPDEPDVILGRVGMHDILGKPGRSELTVAINISKTAKVPLLDANLPNGTPIPIGGLEDAVVIGIPLQKNVKMYFAFGEGVALFGVSFAVKEFGKISNYLGGINIFPRFAFPEAGITAIAGIFTGTAPNTSGIAVFVDVSEALRRGFEGTKMLASAVGVKSMATDRALDILETIGDGPSKLKMADVRPRSRNKEDGVRQHIWMSTRGKNRLSLVK